MKKTLFSLLVLLAALVAQAQTALKVSVRNPLSVRRTAVPVTIQLEQPVPLPLWLTHVARNNHVSWMISTTTAGMNVYRSSSPR